MAAPALERPSSWARLLRGGVFALLAWLAIAIELSPAPGGGWPTPDLLLALAIYWRLTRPGSAPAALIFVFAMLRDALSGGAIGAGALAVLLTVEVMAALGPHLRRRGVWLEWLAVALAAFAAGLGQMLLLILVFAASPSLAEVAARAGATALAYPVIAFVIRRLLRISPRVIASEDAPVLAQGRRA